MLQTDFPEFDPSIAKEFGGDSLSGGDLLGIPLFDLDSMLQLLMRFGFNMLICWIIIRWLYYRKNGRRDFLFTSTLFSITVFMLVYLLGSIRLQIGMALGLFAIFGIIRYRTEQVSIREMTYLFAIIGISVINGLAMTVSYAELVVTNLFFIVAIAILENRRIVKQTSSKVILYEKIDLIKPENYDQLKADLEARTGLSILKIEVGHIDFLRDVAFIKFDYKQVGKEPNTIDSFTRLNQF